jgi:hypothetical protein
VRECTDDVPRAQELVLPTDRTCAVSRLRKQRKNKCNRDCGTVMHMTGGAHRTDCAAYSPNQSNPLPTRCVNVNFDVTQEVARALRVLRDTGMFGTGDCASVADELLRWALLQPSIRLFWEPKP